jgi:hypothetical protein
MELCQEVVKELVLPPFAAMPLVAKAFASSLITEKDQKNSITLKPDARARQF